MAKADVKTKSKPKATAAVQALKKKYQEQRLNKAKTNLTKLALKGLYSTKSQKGQQYIKCLLVPFKRLMV